MTLNDEAARQADLVIEAVPEEMESKIEIFTLLDKICRPGTILASNTSSLSISEIAGVTYRAQQCVGMHFFNPVHKMKLIEVVPEHYKRHAHHWLILHGRYTCVARRPLCEKCVIADLYKWPGKTINSPIAIGTTNK